MLLSNENLDSLIDIIKNKMPVEKQIILTTSGLINILETIKHLSVFMDEALERIDRIEGHIIL